MADRRSLDLSVVIVNYNGGQLILDCLDSLRANPPTAMFETIVVDNASTDGSAARVAENFPDVELLRLDRNLGLTIGFNRAVALARGRHVLSLDNDTVVLPGSVQAMVDFLDREPCAGACGCALIDPDGTPQLTARRFPQPLNALFGRRSVLTRWFPGNPISRRYLMTDRPRGDTPYEVDSLSTACLAVRHEVIDAIGPLDEGFFVYWCDTDWCRRITRAGWAIHSLPGARVIHNENLKGRHRKGRRVRSVIDFHRGAYRYFRKHHVRSRLSPMNAVAIVGLSARAAILLAADEARLLLRRLRPHGEAS